jgi:hypothetical protein
MGEGADSGSPFRFSRSTSMPPDSEDVIDPLSRFCGEMEDRVISRFRVLSRPGVARR